MTTASLGTYGHFTSLFRTLLHNFFDTNTIERAISMSPVPDTWITGHCGIYLYATLVQLLCHPLDSCVTNLTHYLKNTTNEVPKEYMEMLKLPALLLMFIETTSEDNLQLHTLCIVQKLLEKSTKTNSIDIH